MSGATSKREPSLRAQLQNLVNNDVVVALSRMDQARELLEVWISEYPDTDLARMSRSLVERMLSSDPY